jgi:hypothetical protein
MEAYYMPRVEVPKLGDYVKPALNPGTYRVEVKHAEPKTSRKGTKGIFSAFEVLEGPEQVKPDGETEDCEGREFVLSFWFPHSGMTQRGQQMMGERIEQFVNACGADIEDEGFDTDDLVGAQLWISLDNETNEQTNEVRESFKRARPA